MADYKEIYRTQADAYDRLVQAEDTEGNVLKNLQQICSLDGITVVEVGVGTGRLTRQIFSCGAKVHGIEPSPEMLEIAHQHIKDLGGDPSLLTIGTFDALPYEDHFADLSIAGWVFGHQVTWSPTNYLDMVRQGILEMERVVRPGGVLAILETQGTGYEAPHARPEHERLFRFFEEDLGFSRMVFQTDYLFQDVDEAIDTLEFFFGASLSQKIRQKQWHRVPEWTGLWTKKV